MPSQPNLQLPVTGSFALPFTGYFILLSLRVALRRIKQRVAIGDRTPPSPALSPAQLSSPTPTTPDIHTSNDPLLLATRAQTNFAEFVPLALTLSAVAELNGADPGVLRATLGVLLVARVAHAEMGVLRRDGMGFGRPVGFYATLGVLGWLAWVGGRGGWV